MMMTTIYITTSEFFSLKSFFVQGKKLGESVVGMLVILLLLWYWLMMMERNKLSTYFRFFIYLFSLCRKDSCTY